MTKKLNEEKLKDLLEPVFGEIFLDNNFFYSVVLIISLVLFAYFVKYLVIRTLKIFARKTKNYYDDQIIDALESPIFYTILFTGLSILLSIFLEHFKYWNYISGIITTVILFIWVFALMRISKIIVDILSESKKIKIVNYQSRPLFRNLFITAIFTLGACVIFSTVWDIDMTAFIASLGVVGIAVGFAAKDTLSNLFSGVFIIADKPYKVGDYIILSSGERGKVTSIGIRSTRIITALKTEISIPNSIIGNSKIINESQGEGKSFVLGIPFSVAYGEDIEKVENIITELVKDGEFEDFIQEDTTTTIRFSAMAASSLDFNVYINLKDPKFKGQVKSNLNKKIYNTFTKEGIEIPYAKQDLYIKEFPKK